MQPSRVSFSRKASMGSGDLPRKNRNALMSKSLLLSIVRQAISFRLSSSKTSLTLLSYD